MNFTSSLVVPPSVIATKTGDRWPRKKIEMQTTRLTSIGTRVEIATLTAEEKAAFAKATRPVFDKWAATIGPDLVKKAEAVIAKGV